MHLSVGPKMKFSWRYEGPADRKLRSVLKSFGVTSSLIKVAVYHGGKMQINGEDKWTVDLVHPGDEVSLFLPPEQPNDHINASEQPIQIVYEDDDFLILNKPAGVATVPAHHVVTADSLVNRVKGYYLRQNYENLVTHVATRLDKDTSGLVVFPKHRFAHAVLDRQLKRHQVKKNYLAIVDGQLRVQHGYIDAPIDRDPVTFVQRTVIASGKPSATEYWLQAVSHSCSLVKIRLHTGRTHQIRVHFKYLGHPLVGDQMYGGPNEMKRQALHCYWMQFYSPFKDQLITVSAPLPEDMQQFIDCHFNEKKD